MLFINRKIRNANITSAHYTVGRRNPRVTFHQVSMVREDIFEELLGNAEAEAACDMTRETLPREYLNHQHRDNAAYEFLGVLDVKLPVSPETIERTNQKFLKACQNNDLRDADFYLEWLMELEAQFRDMMQAYRMRKQSA